ncbi:VOC family protein [Jannaschia sp. S6380]|uniref:VOC family protein n=1 Tax=Jannaschia sp. S6380 TaxID=2926408 RepID=UPI001FF105CB|nr:VOC family protein [Jannaschia sp. S6380]MCK0167152.1 VOC family protein [Jannaschia sp. S6380]
MTAPDFIEIGSDDPAAAKAFFGALFDWPWVAMDDAGAGYFEDGARQVGLNGGDAPCVVPNLAVPDIDAAASRVAELGGTLMGRIENAGPLGRFATCKDPRGARFGLHQRPD